MKRVIALVVLVAVIAAMVVACYPPTSPTQQEVPQELAGPVRDWNVPGILTVGGGVNFPDGSIPWQDITRSNMPDELLPESPTWSSDVAISGTLAVSDTTTFLSNVVFEGATGDAYETTFAITDPTADRTITFPNSTGTVALNPYGASIEFEGATANDFETTLAVADPTTPDKTVTLPDATGTVMLSTLATNAPDAANAVTGASNALVLEGATANDFETTISPTDPTADRTITLPDATGIAQLTTKNVLVKSADYSVLAADTGSLIKSSGNITMTLPAAAAGLNFCIVNYDGGDLTLDVTDTADVFLNEVNSPGDRVTNTTAFDNICVTAIDTTNWVTIASLGTWADGN